MMQESALEGRPSSHDKPHRRVVQWVVDYVRRETWLCVGGSIGLFLFGLFVLYITFWVWYGLLGFILWNFVPVSHGMLLLGATLICVLLFVAEWTVDREHLERIEVERDDRTRVAVWIARAAGYGYLVPMLGRQYASSYIKILSVLLLIAPQSLMAACRLAWRAVGLRHLDVDACSRVLMVLLQADGKVTFSELGHRVPNVDWEQLLPRMREIVGVVFLFSPPAGVTLAPHLHEEITGRSSH